MDWNEPFDASSSQKPVTSAKPKPQRRGLWILKHAVSVVLLLWVLLIAYSGINALMIREVDAVSGTLKDGFGRQLTQTPAIVRILFSNDSVWPGFYWVIVDFIAGWCLVIGFYLLGVWRFAMSSESDNVA